MPKLKSCSGAKKRFRLTASGKVKRNKAYARHILTKKSSKRKRALRQGTIVTHADHLKVLRMLTH